MSQHLEPSRYQGRPLARPAAELTDQGLAFDVGTLLDRRRLLRIVGLGATAAGLAGCSPSTGPSTSPATSASSGGSIAASGEIPDETAGPYPGDGSNGPDVLEQSGVVRRDIRSSFGGASGTAAGIPMTLELTIRDLAQNGQPFAGVAVYVWHCTREGGYSLYSAGITAENYLRGVQVADADGTVSFTSIFPACYSGRWPHIHFEVYPDTASTTDAAKVIATSQVALPQDVCDQVYATTGYSASVTNLAAVSLAEDNVFGDDDGVHQLADVTGDVGSGFRVALTVAVDPRTTPTRARNPGGRAPSGGSDGGAPGGPRPSGPPSGASTPG